MKQPKIKPPKKVCSNCLSYWDKGHIKICTHPKSPTGGKIKFTCSYFAASEL